MKKIVALFNSPYFGGAERSFSLQLDIIRNMHKESTSIDFIVPFLNKKTEAHNLVKSLTCLGFDKENISFFKYDNALFSFSRRHNVLGIIFLIFSFVKTIKSLSQYHIRHHDIWWANGNKIGFISFLYSYLCGFRGTFFWHFRDYPAHKGAWRFIWLFLRLPKRFHLKIIANSFDVARTLYDVGFDKNDVIVVYNPVPHNAQIPVVKKKKVVIGAAAMGAPWKGLHKLVTYVSLYEKKLRDLGVDCIYIYGDDIYKTKGTHLNYFKQIRTLSEKLVGDFIVFKGLASPEEIFSNIDIFLHTSIRPEPFGRVVVEALASAVPVLTTGLGGAGELVHSHVFDCQFSFNDPDDLLAKIERFLGDERESVVQGGLSVYKAIDEKTRKQLSSLF